jgi:hypothetical protein
MRINTFFDTRELTCQLHSPERDICTQGLHDATGRLRQRHQHAALVGEQQMQNLQTDMKAKVVLP